MSAYEVPTPKDGVRRFAVVHYNRNGLVVTDNVLIRGAVRYEVADIEGLGKSTGSLHPGVWAALAVGAGEIVIVGASAAATQSAMAWVIAVVALAVPCGVALHCAVRWPREMRLLAEYRGSRVTLFRSREKVEFGQVSRAVQRAVELHRGEV